MKKKMKILLLFGKKVVEALQTWARYPGGSRRAIGWAPATQAKIEIYLLAFASTAFLDVFFQPV